MNLGRSGLLSWVSSVGLGSSGFGEENPPSDPLSRVLVAKIRRRTSPVSGQPVSGSARAVWAGGSVLVDTLVQY